MSLRAWFRAAVVTGTMATATVPAIAGQTAASVKTPPPGWYEARRSTLQLTLDGKHREIIALAEKWVAKYPTFADAHLMLGGGYESIARDLFLSKEPTAHAERVRLFEIAAGHFRRAFELGGGESPEIAIRVLADIYGIVGLNRPAEQEKVAREAVVRFPAEPRAHIELISLRLEKGEDPAAVEKAVAAARAALPKTAEARVAVGRQLAFYAAGREPTMMLSPEATTAMARVALVFVNDALAIDPKHREALAEKSALEQLRTKQPE